MARGVVRYKKSSRGTVELMTSPEMLAIMMAAAEKAKPFAEGIAPRRTGHYAASFKVSGVLHGGPKRDRAEAQLANTAVYGAAVEAKHDVLGRTVDFVEGNGA